MSLAAGGRGRVPMLEVNPHVMCVLCGGYFIDATTIIECLHSFCRKCIVTYLESSRFCPICDVQVHKTKPLLSIRPDATLQDIVYKLVPGLYRDEMRRRREFYAARPASELPCERGEARGEERRAVFAPDEQLVVRLQYQYHSSPPCPAQVRYLRCPAQVTVGHLQHMISCKHELPAGRRVELLARGEVLTSDLMLLDVAYLYCWRRVGPLQLFYRIVTVKRELAEVDTEPAKVAASAAEAAARACRDTVSRELLPNGGEPRPAAPAPAPAPAEATRPPPPPTTDVKEKPSPPAVTTAPAPAAAPATAAVAPAPAPAKKRTDSGECKEVQLHISETGEMSFGNGPAASGGQVDILQQACSILDSLETEEPEPAPPPRSGNGAPPPPPPQPPPLLPPPVKGPIRDNNKNEIAPEPRPARPPDDTGQKRPAKEAAPGRPRPRGDDGRKRSSPVGYKTLKTPPKSWNPQLPRSYVGAGQKAADAVRTVSPIAPKPPRFFKMRHSSGAAGGPPAEAARAPLLMRVEPAGLPPAAVWSDQLLSAGPPLLYPHLYATQPLSFLPGPAVSMFAPPPAHSGVSQLTYTSASGSFSPLLAMPRPPAQRHLSAPLKSTSANGAPKVAQSAAAGRSPPPLPPPSSPSPSPARERPHISCSVPSTRPRPSERPPSAAPASVASAAVASRLSLSSFIQQNMATGQPAVLGGLYAGGRPLTNGQPPAGPRKDATPAVRGDEWRSAPRRDEAAVPRTKERPTLPPGSAAPGVEGVKAAPVPQGQVKPAPPPAQQVKALVDTCPAVRAPQPPPASVRPENTAVTQS